MGWGNCGTDSKGRLIGYYHSGTCDHPGCEKEISRGVDAACGGMHGTDEGGCEQYFCDKHLEMVPDYDQELRAAQLCESCAAEWNKTHEWKEEDL